MKKSHIHLKPPGILNSVGSILVPGAFFDDNWLHFYCQNYHYLRLNKIAH
jgi:hypothetical protein